MKKVKIEWLTGNGISSIGYRNDDDVHHGWTAFFMGRKSVEASHKYDNGKLVERKEYQYNKDGSLKFVLHDKIVNGMGRRIATYRYSDDGMEIVFKK